MSFWDKVEYKILLEKRLRNRKVRVLDRLFVWVLKFLKIIVGFVLERESELGMRGIDVEVGKGL